MTHQLRAIRIIIYWFILHQQASFDPIYRRDMSRESLGTTVAITFMQSHFECAIRSPD
jgi:hypothetical protein